MKTSGFRCETKFGLLVFLGVKIQDLKVSLELRILYVLYNILGKSPQNGTERVSVTSAKTFFSLKDWAKMKSESSIIYVTMEKKHSGQAPTLGL